MAFFGVIEKYILGGHWSCIGRHKLPDGAKRGGGTTKIKKQIIPSQPIHKLPDRVKGADLLQKNQIYHQQSTITQTSDEVER